MAGRPRAAKLIIQREEPDGTRTVHRFVRDSKGKVSVTVDDGPAEVVEGAVDLLDLAARTGDALVVGPGVTELGISGLDEQAVLARLRLGAEASEDDWQEWEDEIAESVSIDGDGGWRLGRWRIASNDGVAVVLTDGTATVPLGWSGDLSADSIQWEPMFSWGFSNEGSGPVIWDGGCNAGLLAPGVLLEVEQGDQDPGIRVTTFPPERLVETVADRVEDWAFEILLNAVGYPGLDDEDTEALYEVETDNESSCALNCGPELSAEILATLIARNPGLEEARRALLDPKSPRGRIVYAWLRGLAETKPIKEAVDWMTVLSALKGEVGRPTPL